MKHELMDDILDLLYLLRADQTLVYHSLHVWTQAKKLLAQLRPEIFEKIDQNLVLIGALAHDIGRTKVHNIFHGVKGGEILREHGFPEELAKICERHIGAGIPLSEAKSLGLPPKDYVPTTIEEKLVCYADKLVSYTFYKHNPSWWCIKESFTHPNVNNELKKLGHSLGKNHPALDRMRALEQEIFLMLKEKI